MKRVIMGIQIDKREDVATKVQELLTTHGCIIRTRLGLHETGNTCSSHGMIILDFEDGKDKEIAEMLTTLNLFNGVVAKILEF
jgi:ribose 5-phosphate isomerase